MASFWDAFLAFWGNPIVLQAILILVWILFLLLCVAYLTFAERKVMAAVQIRRGPNVVGPWGLLQPLADGVKLVFKETIIPTTANRVVFMIAPMITFILALVAWAVIPFNDGYAFADINVGVLYLFAISSLGVYGVIMAGWASNSKYPFLGALRSAAQMVSYEVSIGFVIITVLLAAHSLNLNQIIESQRGESGYFWNWYAFGMLAPMAVIFFISALAETNRVPFDLPEGESELVAGFFAEYSSMSFGLFFLGEYANIILMSTTTALFFLGGWLPPFPFVPFTWIPGWIWFLLKVLFIVFLFLLVRATFPRYRYDQLMRLGWKVFLPFSLLWVVLTAGAVLVLPRWVL
jgi:NADH-quinone oxidoreductase subunit H